MNPNKTFKADNIGRIKVKNRIFRSATNEGFAEERKVGENLAKLYSDLSNGNVGLMIVGYSVFSKSDYNFGGQLGLDDKTIPSIQKLVIDMHANETKIVMQLNHSGSQFFANPGGPVIGPSQYTDPLSHLQTRAMTVEEIKELVKEFGTAANISKEAGFDGVQIHAGHGYLLNKFISSLYNTRTDEYGGILENRMRIIEEIFLEIKEVCGSDYPVWIKLSSHDYESENKGYTTEDFLEIGEKLSKLGMDAIEVTGGQMYSEYSLSRQMKHSAYHFDAAKSLAGKVESSVILVGGIREIDLIDSILEDTKIAAVSMSRALIREPNLVKRWEDGDRSKAKCIACNGCFNPTGVRCFFALTLEEQEKQKPIMQMMQSKN